jgi:DNA repair exonuclease SbcCD ATPase subunit
MEDSVKKTQLATILVASFILIIALVGGVMLYNKKQAQIESLMVEKANNEQMMQQKDSIMIDMDNSFYEIENNLKSIKEKRNQIAMVRAEGKLNRKQAILDDISLLDNMIEENNKKIADLEQKLKKSGLSLKAYEKRLQSLTETIESQNAEIAELKKVVETKNMTLAELDSKIKNLNNNLAQQADTISYKQKVIVDKTDKLNTAHVVLGTYKELKKEGILDREGGVLGLGTNKAIQENFDPKHFTELDIRKTKTIAVNAKKAVVISEHPKSSYKLVEENGQIAYLQIENPEEFWRISKYAVIQVK